MTREYFTIKGEENKPGISIEIIEETRKITFDKDCLDQVEIFRKDKNDKWISIAKNISSPYYDIDKMKKGIWTEYKVCIFTNQGEKKAETLFRVKE